MLVYNYFVWNLIYGWTSLDDSLASYGRVTGIDGSFNFMLCARGSFDQVSFFILFCCLK